MTRARHDIQQRLSRRNHQQQNGKDETDAGTFFRVGMQLLHQPEAASEYREALQKTERARYFAETVLKDQRYCQDDGESQQHGAEKQTVQYRGG
jgi:hypothetical protein